MKNLIKKNRFIITSLFLILAFNCRNDNNLLKEFSTQADQVQAAKYNYNDSLNFNLSPKDENVQVIIKINDEIFTDRLDLTPKIAGLGNNTVHLQLVREGNVLAARDLSISIYAEEKPAAIGYKILNEYPHNADYFTQGFQYHDGYIFEGTGMNRKSRLIKYKLGDTNPVKEIKLPDEIFGEGITVLNGKAYQLSWRNKILLVYNSDTFELENSIPYPYDLTEGWGITTDGSSLIISDGSQKIRFYNPETLENVKTIQVVSHEKIHSQINELEYFDGYIYANIWRSAQVLKINPENGLVAGIIDLTQIAKENTKGVEDVLNGIAFKGNHMLITGKNWGKIYELELE